MFFPAYRSVHYCMSGVHEGQIGHGVPRNLSYRQLGATMWVLTINSRSSGRTATVFNNGDIAPSPLQILSLIFHIRSSCQRWKASTSVPAHDWNGAVYSPMSVLEVCTWCLNPESMSEAQHNQSHACWPRNGSSILWWHCWPPSMGNLFRLFRHFVRCSLRALCEMSFIIGFAELCCFPGDSNLLSNIVR